MSYKELESIYRDNFGIGFLNTNFEERLAVIGLICNITDKARKKKPSTTCYQVIKSIMKNTFISNDMEKFIVGLSIMCEEAMYNCTTFPNFDISDNKKIIAKIHEILETFIPF